jgi:hypothetical protein
LLPGAEGAIRQSLSGGLGGEPALHLRRAAARSKRCGWEVDKTIELSERLLPNRSFANPHKSCHLQNVEMSGNNSQSSGLDGRWSC